MKKIIILSIVLFIVLIIFIDTPPFLDGPKNIEASFFLKNGMFFEDGMVSYMGFERGHYRDTHPPFVPIIASIFNPYKNYRPYYVLNVLLYIFSFILACRVFKKPILTFLIYLCPSVIVLVNSYMYDHLTFIFLVFSMCFYKLYLEKDHVKYNILLCVSLTFAIFTSYAVGLILIILFIDHYIKRRKISIAIIIPGIILLIYIILVYLKTGSITVLEALKWPSGGIYLHKFNIFEKILYTAVALGFVCIILAISLLKKKILGILTLIFLFFLGIIQSPFYNIFGIMISMLSFVYVMVKLKKREKIYSLIIFFIVLFIYPFPVVRNYAILLPFLMVGLNEIKGISVKIAGVLFALLFLIGISDHSHTFHRLIKKIDMPDKVYTVSEDVLRFFVRKEEYDKKFLKGKNAKISIITNYRERTFAAFRENDTILSNMPLDREYPLYHDISLIKTYTESTRFGIKVHPNASFFTMQKKNPLPIYFERSRVNVNLFKVNAKKTELFETPEIITDIRFKDFIFEGYDMKTNEEKIEVSVYLEFKRFVPVMVFLHCGEGKDLIQDFKGISRNDLRSDNRVKIDLNIPKCKRGPYIIFTDEKASAFKDSTGKQKYPIEYP